jgi:hypothetical protein
MSISRSNVNRKRMFRASIATVILMGLFLCPVNTPVGTAQSVGGFEGAIYDIVPDSSTLSNLPATGNTFFLTGKIYPFRTINQATCDPVGGTAFSLGTWRAWGQVADGGRVVMNQSLQLEALNGTIEVQGVSGVTLANEGRAPAIAGALGPPFTGPTETLAATGGAGTFRGANGEVQVRPYCQNEADTTRPFRYDRPFCLSLKETPRRRGGDR